MPTFTLIASSTVGSGGGVASIDFTSIPSTYTDLCLKVSARNTKNASTFLGGIKFNSITTNFSFKYLGGSGSSAFSVGGSGSEELIANGPTSTSDTFSNFELYIPNYAGSLNKSFSLDSVVEDNSSSGNFLQVYAGLWSNTAAINSISLYDIAYGSAFFVQHTTAYLYGVSNA